MQTILLAILVVAASVAVAVAGLFMRRRYIPAISENEALAGYFNVLGVMYGVLLAFVIFLVWSEFQQAKDNITREANYIGDIFLMTRSFPPPFPDQVKRELLTYTRLVIEQEWKTMEQGQSSAEVQNSLDRLWKIFEGFEPSAHSHTELYAKAIEQLNNLSDSRRLRLHASHDTIPVVIWVLLFSGGILTIGYSHFFEVKSRAIQAWMTAGLTGSIALILFLILAMDRPFSGDIKLDPEPLQRMFHRIETL